MEPPYLALSKNMIKMTAKNLFSEINIVSTDDEEPTPLSCATTVQMVKYLHEERSADQLEKCLLTQRANPVCMYCIEKGADVNVRNAKQQTPLILAASVGNTKLSMKLIEHSTDLNAKDEELVTPLMAAAKGYDKELAEYLLGRGVLLDERDKEGRTALHLRTAAQDLSWVQLLVDKVVTSLNLFSL